MKTVSVSFFLNTQSLSFSLLVTDTQKALSGQIACPWFTRQRAQHSGIHMHVSLIELISPCNSSSNVHHSDIIVSMQILLTGFQTLHEVHCIQRSRKKSFQETFKVAQALSLQII